MRNCIKTNLYVIIVCQKLNLAKVTQEKYVTSQNCKDSCIALFTSVLVFLSPQITKNIDTSGHIPGISDAQGR